LLYVTMGSSIANLSRSFASADDILDEFLESVQSILII
jgi:hypothetical protein